MDYIIRKIRKDDAYDVIHVVTISWNETYKGIVPDDFLELLKHNEQERVEKFHANFSEDTYVLEVDNKVVGFAKYGTADSEEFPNTGELKALYIINKYQKYGYGRMLVDKVKETLKSMGYNKMIITCLKGNPSNEFYKHVGGVYIKDGIYKKLNLAENIYLFNI